MPAFEIFEIETPYLEADLRKIRFEQTADVMVLACYGYPLKRLRRFGHADWRLDDAPIGAQIAAPTGVAATANDPTTGTDFVATVKYYVVTAVNAAGQESPPSIGTNAVNDLSLKGNNNVITWTAQANAASYRIYEERSGVFGFLGEVTKDFPSFMDDNILADFSNGPPKASDPFADGANPSAVAFHESRLFCGRLPAFPSALYGSKSDDIFNFDVSRPVQATDSIALNLRAKRVNAIQHLVSLGGLLALTNDAIFSITPTQDGYLSPISLQSKVEGAQGVGQARPEIIVDVLFYATARGSGIRTLNYMFEKDGFGGNDLTVFAPHLFQDFTVTHMAWCKEPSSVLWCLRSDGKMPTLTWQAEQDVWGWSLCDTDGAIESICSVAENGVDTLYLVVNRTTDDEAPLRYVERLTVPHWISENWTDQAGAVVMDASVTYRGAPVTILTRLFHLEGRDVSVLADGLVVEGRSVINGRLTPDLEIPASVVSIGLPYFSYIRTLPIVAQAQGIGSTKGRRQIVTNAVMEFLNTAGAEYGVGTERGIDQLYEVEFPDFFDVTPKPLFSGFIDAESFPNTDWRDAVVTIAQRQPLPMVILGVYPDVDVSSG